MSLAKIVISGTVYREPQKRYTQNNVAVTSFTLNTEEETFIRVVAIGNLAETVEQNVKKDAKVVVEGRLQTATHPDESGSEKKTLEIGMQSFELLSGTNIQTGSNTTYKSEVVKFSETEESAEKLIGEEEIPF